MTSTLRVWDVTSGECLRTLAGHTGRGSTPWRSRLTGTRPSRPVRRDTPRVGRRQRGMPEDARRDTRMGRRRGAHARRAHGRLRQCGQYPPRVGRRHAGNASGRSRDTRQMVCAVAITPDGHTAVSASEDETLRVWDVATGECLQDAHRTHGYGQRPWRSRPTGTRPSRPVMTRRSVCGTSPAGECLRTLHGHTALWSGRGAHARRAHGRLGQFAQDAPRVGRRQRRMPEDARRAH